MRAPGSEHPTVRAFAIILAIVAIVMVFQLYAPLAVLGALLSIAFAVVMAYALYKALRNRRSDIALWPARAQLAYYGAIFVAIANMAVYYGARLFGLSNWQINGFAGTAWLLVFPICGYTIWRVWREQHTYS